MNAKDNGGPAFPIASDLIGHDPGMTLRDWFAGQALAGLASNCTDAGLSTWLPDSIGARAYQFADAMLEARK